MKFRRLKGRIVEQLLETTVRELENNVNAMQSDLRQNATTPVMVNSMKLIPMRGQRESGVLKVEAQVTSKDRKYNPVVQFEEVQFEDTDRTDNVSFTGPGKQEFHVMPINLAQNDVKVRCDCLDFYYTFSSYNNSDGSLYGEPFPPYQRKTTTRPPRNPAHKPGMCKHLLRVIQELKNEGVVR